MKRIGYHLSKETRLLHPRILLARLFAAFLPPFFGGTLRAYILRLAGFQVGPHTVFWGMPILLGTGNIHKNLIIGAGCKIGVQTYFDLGNKITLQDSITLGPQCMMITGAHQIGPAHQREGPLETHPICIGNGVWMGARCTILPGVNIGPGAVIGAGAVVNRDIPPHTLAAGVPARVIRKLLMESSIPQQEDFVAES